MTAGAVNFLSLHNPSLWWDTFLTAAAAKFICAFISARWPGGAGAILKTWPGRLVYAAGKITPLIAIGAVLIYFKLEHPSTATWVLVLVFAALLVYDGYVVWLRLTGRWYGAGALGKRGEGRGKT